MFALFPPRGLTWLRVGLVSLPMLFGRSSLGGGYTPEEARARMVVPAGFHVEVFACEPMVRPATDGHV